MPIKAIYLNQNRLSAVSFFPYKIIIDAGVARVSTVQTASYKEYQLVLLLLLLGLNFTDNNLNLVFFLL